MKSIKILAIFVVMIFMTAASSPPLTMPQEASIAFVGDLMVHQWQLDHAYDKKTGFYSFDYGFEPIKKYIKEADYAIGNLETTLAGRKIGYSDFPCFNTPDSFAGALKRAGFDFLTTSNNHCMDKGWDGLSRTIDILNVYRLEHTGTFKTLDESQRICIKEINGISFAFLAYTYGTNGIPVPSDKPWAVSLLDEALIERQIAAAKELNPDFIIMLPHMGNEYEETPSTVYRNWAMFMLKAGADVVIVSHPHVVQSAEFVTIEDNDGRLRDCFIMHSLGNFISSQRTLPRDAGLILKLRFEKTSHDAELKNVSFIPTWVEFVNNKGSYDIRTLSIYDGLTSYEDGNPYNLRAKDIVRLRQAHDEITRKMLGQPVPLKEIRDEYSLISLE